MTPTLLKGNLVYVPRGQKARVNKELSPCHQDKEFAFSPEINKSFKHEAKGVAHSYNPSDSEVGDLEDHCLRPALQKVHKTPSLPIKIWVW
jgi:hypothetical protein